MSGSRTPKRSGQSDNSDQQAITLRFDSEVYTGLSLAASASSSSVNSLVNGLARDYLTSAKGKTAITDALARQQEAIRKLSGG
jgi:hypothetical protein